MGVVYMFFFLHEYLITWYKMQVSRWTCSKKSPCSDPLPSGRQQWFPKVLSIVCGAVTHAHVCCMCCVVCVSHPFKNSGKCIINTFVHLSEPLEFFLLWHKISFFNDWIRCVSVVWFWRFLFFEVQLPHKVILVSVICCIYYELITISLVNVLHHTESLFLVTRTFKTYSLNFQMCKKYYSLGSPRCTWHQDSGCMWCCRTLPGDLESELRAGGDTHHLLFLRRRRSF